MWSCPAPQSPRRSWTPLSRHAARCSLLPALALLRLPRLVGLCILFSPFLAMGRPPDRMHPRFQHVTWNVQTLANASSRKAQEKLDRLAHQLKDVDVFFLQEVHGDEQYVRDLLRPLAHRFDFEYSPTANEISGGVLTAWSKAWAGSA
eukprot:7798059-Pyramimonas_sp.AAC.1